MSVIAVSTKIALPCHGREYAVSTQKVVAVLKNATRGGNCVPRDQYTAVLRRL
jgi:hypothetical protein